MLVRLSFVAWIFVLGVPTALAAPPERARSAAAAATTPHMVALMHADVLKLDIAVEQKLRTRGAEARKSLAEAGETLRWANQTLQEALRAPRPDRRELLRIADEAADAIAAIEQARERHRSEVRALLTERQWQRMAVLSGPPPRAVRPASPRPSAR